MDKTEFLTIYATFENLDVVKQTLPQVIEETRRNDARLIVHDSSVRDRDEKWNYLQDLNRSEDFFLLLSSNLSMAHARNMCLGLGIEQFAPDYVCMLEDDHGYGEGVIPALIDAMREYYGKPAPSGLRYGMFTACSQHTNAKLRDLGGGRAVPDSKDHPFELAGSNSCFRCAPTSHWTGVLRGYDTDEYLISEFQTANLRRRNYHKGFTVLYVGGGELAFSIDGVGRGVSSEERLMLWDNEYCASDARSRFRGKGQRP